MLYSLLSMTLGLSVFASPALASPSLATQKIGEVGTRSARIEEPLQKKWDVHDMERPLPEVVPNGGAVRIPPPPSATVLFDGSDLSAWQHGDGSPAKWKMEGDQLIVQPGTGNLQTTELFGDVHLHIEWMVPESEDKDEGQGRGNSGVFLMGMYEVQVLESLGSRTYADGMAGALYGQYPPSKNYSSGLGKWNSYDIFFRAPAFQEEQTIAPVVITVLHNGHVIHDGVSMKGITRHKTGTQYHLHADALPLSLQDHSDPVHFRNIWVRPLENWDAISANTREEQLKKDVQFLCDLQPARSHEHLSSTFFAAEYIAHQMRGAGLQTEFQEFQVEGVVHRNVVGFAGPDQGPLTILGAHYDSCGDTPGADDNASGVAALLEIAREYGKSAPKRSTQLVAYANEEPPFFGTEHMGSVFHAESLKRAKREVHGMIALEMLGYYSDEPGSQTYPVEGMEKLYPDSASFIAVVTRPEDGEWLKTFVAPMKANMRLDIQTLVAPSFVTGIDFSDHRNYWAAGFPAIMITDTAFFRSPHYHESTDTPDTLNYGHMAQIVDGVLTALETPGKPDSVKNSAPKRPESK